ncbi:hypothetical protein PN498_10765 [Oscillatoria sp. CS-180]|uniref:hypothetical protein n=1 Tax=Oscillatoria sp. CS-180 TaxID=3021720 RepID=UPI00232DFA62|nr:hypothetical protein [Oscillatoria sp. CS-180]MDB9526471.1 hypothetical protein [Oscillatoria sp. CS-180]
MNLCLHTSHFRFVYVFESGHKLIGTVKGDSYGNTLDVIFNLRSLKAICLNNQGNLIMGFDQVFGQFTLHDSEAVLAGSQAGGESFFSFNYRDAEASIYDARRNVWVATGWDPNNWHVKKLVKPKNQSLVITDRKPEWASRAIA